MIRGIVIGVCATVIVLILCAYAVIKSGLFPANADARPSRLEAWMARSSLSATIHREAPKGDNPLPATDQNLLAGMKLYAANCQVCHGGSDGKATNVAHGLYQKPPQLASFGVEDDPAGVTFWKIDHGIRLTGMPAYTLALSETQIWQLTAFLQNMDRLPESVNAQWKRARISETIAPAALQMHRRRENARSGGR